VPGARRKWSWAGASLGAGLIVLGCSGEDSSRPDCIELGSSCEPLYLPEFQAVFDNTLSRTCAQAGGACHSAEGHHGGLVFTDIDQSYALLLGQDGGKARVKPGNASCSELIVRLESVGEDWQMPPGTALPARERCSIRRWVELGAPRQ